MLASVKINGNCNDFYLTREWDKFVICVAVKDTSNRINHSNIFDAILVTANTTKTSVKVGASYFIHYFLVELRKRMMYFHFDYVQCISQEYFCCIHCPNRLKFQQLEARVKKQIQLHLIKYTDVLEFDKHCSSPKFISEQAIFPSNNTAGTNEALSLFCQVPGDFRETSR